MSTREFQNGFRGAGEFEPVASPLYGLRQWRMRRGPRLLPAGERVPAGRVEGLTSTFLHIDWSPGANVAECRVGLLEAMRAYAAGKGFSLGRTMHDVPHPPCQCGFWAYSPPAGWPVVLQDFACPTVVGVIEAWGRAVVGPLGFRAEKARILALAFPEPGATSPDVVTSSAYALQHRLIPLVEQLCNDPDHDHDLGVPTGHWEVTTAAARDDLAAAYPAVAQFSTVEAMLAEFPLTDLAALAGAA